MAVVRARIATAYRLRYGAMAALCLGFAAWFLYDGYVKYPAARELRQQYEAYTAEHGAASWPGYAREHGLPDGTYGTPGEHYSDGDVLAQKVLGFVALPIGLALGLAFLRTLGRWVEADEQGIATNQDERVPYESIRSLDRRRWRSKGIAVLTYDDGGRIGTIVLDDWKFERQATVAIFNYLESRLPPEIIRDQPQAPPEAEA